MNLITATLLQHMGGDIDVVNAARVSFRKEVDVLKQSDENLIRYLACGMTSAERIELATKIMSAKLVDETYDLIDMIQRKPIHFAPFTHVIFKFHIKAPLFVARQLWKSHIGLANQDEPLGWSEVSRRYVDDQPEFYQPAEWRSRAQNVKQGSGAPLGDIDAGLVESIAHTAEITAHACYNHLLGKNVAPELARGVLSQNMMTEWIWTGSLLAFSRICVQRLDDHAQQESREVAGQIYRAIEPLAPVSWAALMKGLKP